jgi:hypothetical protein
MDVHTARKIAELNDLAATYASMDVLRDELRGLEARLEADRAYFAKAGGCLALALRLHDRLEARRSEAAARLRAVRRQAHRRLGLIASTAPAAC